MKKQQQLDELYSSMQKSVSYTPQVQEIVISVDMFKEGLISREELLLRIHGEMNKINITEVIRTAEHFDVALQNLMNL